MHVLLHCIIPEFRNKEIDLTALLQAEAHPSEPQFDSSKVRSSMIIILFDLLRRGYMI